jgi:hypothetical protein
MSVARLGGVPTGRPHHTLAMRAFSRRYVGASARDPRASCRNVVLVQFGRLYFGVPGAVRILLEEGPRKGSKITGATPVYPT